MSPALSPRSLSYSVLLSETKNNNMFLTGLISGFAAAATEIKNHCADIRAAQAESEIGDEGEKSLGKKGVDIVWKFG